MGGVMRNKLHEEGFIQALTDLATKEGVEGLFEQGIEPDDAMRNAASYLAVILRGMAPDYTDSPSLSWLERKIESAAKGADPELLDALFKPVRLRGRPSLPRELRRRIAAYVAVQSEVFYRPLTTGDYNDDSAFAAAASRFKQSVSTVRRCAKEFFPSGIPRTFSLELTQDQATAFRQGFDDAKRDGEESFQISYRWLARCLTDQQRATAIEYSESTYGYDVFTLFAEADEGFGFSEETAQKAHEYRWKEQKKLSDQWLIRYERSNECLTHVPNDMPFRVTGRGSSPQADREEIIESIFNHAIWCSNYQIDLNIFEEGDTP